MNRGIKLYTTLTTLNSCNKSTHGQITVKFDSSVENRTNIFVRFKVRLSNSLANVLLGLRVLLGMLYLVG